MNSEPDIAGTNLKLKEISLADKIKNDAEKTVKINDKSCELLELSPTEILHQNDIMRNRTDKSFDTVIGHLEDMLIDDDFQKLQNRFLEKYWKEFDYSEENKHSYMIIFNEYSNEIENFITKYLQKRIKNFDMDVFISELMKKKEIQDGELFEMLITLYDFVAFKENFLDYRAMREGHTADLGQSLSITSVTL